MNPLELAGAAFGILGIWLTVREDPRCWPVGLVNVAIFTAVFWGARLYAASGLQVFYAVLAVYGWWAWLRGGSDHGPLAVSRAPRRVLAALLGAGALFAVVLAGLLGRFTDAAMPWPDASAAGLSLAAQALQTRKWIENWTLWIAADLLSAGLYASQSLYLAASLYLVFAALAVAGLRTWRASLAARPA